MFLTCGTADNDDARAALHSHRLPHQLAVCPHIRRQTCRGRPSNMRSLRRRNSNAMPRKIKPNSSASTGK
jgi:hypothetical protein